MKITPEILYLQWLHKFVTNGMPFKIPHTCDIIQFTTYDNYTPFTYKFTFNMSDDFFDPNCLAIYDFKQIDYELFAELFFTNGWEEELEYQLIYYQDRNKIKKTNPNFGDNYGEIKYYVKPWVDYVTFQGYRTIIQFRFDKYERLEKLKEIEKINILYDNV